MIETIVLNYLTTELGVPVHTEQKDIESYVLIEKTGSSVTNFIKSATIAIQSYAGTLYDAATLNETVKAAMSGIIELDSVSSCKLNTDYNYTDQQKKKYRYQAIFELVYFDN